mmetsp:Transcript_7296/g.29595  ORF Transcript_7296/g.29595 Transcript_7296/m.29595 type:complete len:83 (-) Transcript_7296:812-1060(-)
MRTVTWSCMIIVYAVHGLQNPRRIPPSHDTRKNDSNSSTILGGQRLTLVNHSLDLYFEHPTLMRSHANSHSLSASSPLPSDQ